MATSPAISVDFADSALGPLRTYLEIPCLSPAYDPGWSGAGHLERAAGLLAGWARERAIAGLEVEVRRLVGRTPLVVCEAPATTGSAGGTVVFYGHFDKQPPLGAWGEGLDPFGPVRRGPKLYGRGAADDGYAIFAALLALEATERAGRPHGRCVVLLEGSEESGSPDLDAHVEALADRLGPVDLLVCLDSGAPTYDRLWLTQSLRGNVVVTVDVEVLTRGVHSGSAGGVVPSSFRLLRQLLDRVEDARTGEILLPALHAEPPADHRKRFAALAAELGDVVADGLPTLPGLQLAGADAADRLLRQAWAPAMAVVGMDGIPSVAAGGNVLRAGTTANLSFRLPPSVDAARAAEELVAVLHADPPEGARVAVTPHAPASGWTCPPPAPWLAAALDEASVTAFGQPAGWTSEGGTIPFLATLGARFPGAGIVATGVLGPGSNAHSVDESLDLPAAQALTEALAHLLAAHGARQTSSTAGLGTTGDTNGGTGLPGEPAGS